MAGEKGKHFHAQARRVVAGLDADGRSTIVVDELTSARTVTQAFTACDVWRSAELPAAMDDDPTLTGEVDLYPPPNGVAVRVTTFPPDSEWDPATGYGEALDAIGAGEATADAGDTEVAGLHVTDTIDVLTILSGELYAVLETGETLLRPGDTFIQRGTKHAWSNRSDQPATVVAVMVNATR